MKLHIIKHFLTPFCSLFFSNILVMTPLNLHQLLYICCNSIAACMGL